ncbi:hypothetical protein Emtol_2792 [Emticicia oligotrophica DSM 17448]|uniref:DUF2007 domain-containing protein n=1 Tax=Emticicia oligotrophica (strain DSM 17448 / CIP 109782 / MTCC 6937 / GPTSA100-15) TaxID=929562 RepID=A0ABN4AR92_EMTOG|nr:hypothetical protein [Emticicia oligotrophica]AFK03927.1 hypothetical protein Emtol_2792 [Emticicia oligotrophica DSM 17448]
MKILNFLVDLQESLSLQKLKNELNSVGIKAFMIDYLSMQISILGTDSIQAETIDCTVRKADFDSKSFRISN